MKRRLSIFLFLFSLAIIHAQTLTGVVVEQENQKPLSGVKVSLEDTGIWTSTDKNGSFEIKYTAGENLIFSRSGLFEVRRNFAVFPQGKIKVEMQIASIRIKEVVLSAQKKKFSEIEIKEEALQKIQSFSLGDVLQQLPGQYIEPSNNTEMKNIVLRSANTQSPLSTTLDDNDFGNKAFGTQLMINDVAVSNNANMQNFNAANGEPFSSNIGAFTVSTNKGNITPGLANYGADLRQIPTDDIEKIEVIAGIPDAKYGDLTSGLIKVETKTGKRPLQFLSSIIEGTYQIGMSKGFQVNEKFDAINASINYMNSVVDPRAADVKYERYSANLLYSAINKNKTFRNKLGVNLVSDINEGQAGEDEYHGIYVNAKNKSISITNNTQLKFTNSFLKEANINCGFNYGEQNSTRRNFVNSQALPYADAMTDDVYYAPYTPPQYFNYNYVKGKPLSIFTDADVYTVLSSPNKWIHKLSLGLNYRYNDNFGKGRYGTLGTFSATSTAETTAYDPTCGSGSLLLKVADEAHKSISLYGQEKEISTANLAKMNMILHNNATAEVFADNTLSRPHFKNEGHLKSFDYVVANPPFSLKNWSVGVSTDADEFGRFTDFGVPPEKNGDYAFLLHIIKSLKSSGKGAVVLPHGVLFRGNAEAEIRKNVIKKGFIKGIIGLPANLFYGTGIPACIIILDKENASSRKGIFMIDASKDFVKDGDKNKLRERDIRKITDVFSDFTEVEKYSRMVSFAEIANEKNDYNLNIPRYIDNQETEDLQDLFAHLHGGIPAKDVHEMEKFWAVFPAMKKDLFQVKENGYFELKMPMEETKAFILNHPQFQGFKKQVLENFEPWKTERIAHFNTLEKGCHPKEEIKLSGELLLKTFENNPLIDAYDLFQYLMNVYGENMMDDLYSVSLEGWKAGNDWQRLIIKGKKGKNGKSAKDKTVEGLDGILGKLVSPQLIIENYLAEEQKALTDFETEVENIKASLQESEEENAVEEGLFEDLDKVNLTSVKALFKEKKKSVLAKEEAQVFENYITLQETLAETNAFIKKQKTKIEKAVTEIYPTLSEKEIKHLVIEKKWLQNLENALHAETDRISQTLSQRIKELAERYRETLGELENQSQTAEAKVKLHLQKMGY